MSAFLRPRTVNPSSAFSVRLGRVIHRSATTISVLLAVVAVVTLTVAAYQAAINSGEWANDYWFNPDWWKTAPWGVLTAVSAAGVYLASRLIRYLLSRE